MIDANYAGTVKSSQCCLIFCEGDSAKAGVVSGVVYNRSQLLRCLSTEGKLLNVRGETTTKIADNKEIAEIKQILGLQNGKKYTSQDIVNKRIAIWSCSIYDRSGFGWQSYQGIRY